jgi:AcrR family transcriptional regulator
MRHPEKQIHLLEAASRVVLRDGVARLTLDLVAREAGVSKGAVLHYFPTKNALIGAMMQAHMEGFAAELAQTVAAETPAPGRWTRAYLKAQFQRRPHDCEHPHIANEQKGGAGMLAAVANDPELLSIIRNNLSHWQEQITNDGLDPVHATILRLVVDGIFMTEMVGISPLSPDLRQQVIDRLLEMAQPGPETHAEAAQQRP